jgi:hypothetical protein
MSQDDVVCVILDGGRHEPVLQAFQSNYVHVICVYFDVPNMSGTSIASHESAFLSRITHSERFDGCPMLRSNGMSTGSDSELIT